MLFFLIWPLEASIILQIILLVSWKMLHIKISFLNYLTFTILMQDIARKNCNYFGDKICFPIFPVYVKVEIVAFLSSSKNSKNLNFQNFSWMIRTQPISLLKLFLLYIVTAISNLSDWFSQHLTSAYQFGWGISKMVGLKDQDFVKINILKGKKIVDECQFVKKWAYF